MRVRMLLTVMALLSPVSPVSAQQTEIDRTLQRVYNTPIMASDVRQIRLLKLAGPGVDSEAAVLRAFENRLLMLREVARGGLKEPPLEAIAARRQAWTASWPAGSDLPALLARAGMSEQSLDGWFRDDLLLEQYVTQRFGQIADARRAARIADWVRDLRLRANLIEKEL